MHARRQARPSLYEQLEALPEGLTGQILDGQLHTQPRPSLPHGFPASSLGCDLIGPFQRGRGGRGGWWFIDAPELHFVRDAEVDVPDLAGWRRERMPVLPQDHRATIYSTTCSPIRPSAWSGRRSRRPSASSTGTRA